MIASSPVFQEIEAHREAGLSGQLNITTSIQEFPDRVGGASLSETIESG